jgi:hypothetical protein
MLTPTAIEKGGPLACLAHDLSRLSNVAVCLFATFGLTAALTRSVFVAGVSGGLAGSSGELARRSTFMRSFFCGGKNNFKFTTDCEVPHICFWTARVKTMAEAKPLRPNT